MVKISAPERLWRVQEQGGRRTGSPGTERRRRLCLRPAKAGRGHLFISEFCK